jgi:hypothetical protein
VVVPALDRMGTAFTALTRHTVLDSGSQEVLVADTDGRQRTLPADVVVVVELDSDDSVSRELTAAGLAVSVLGSAREPGNLWAAIKEGNRSPR